MSKTEDNNLIQNLFEDVDFNNENIDMNKFKEKFKNENDFNELNNLKQIQKELIIKGCDLNLNILDNKGNKEFKWSQGEKRGGFDYIPPPKGWKGFGISVLNKYDNGNNDWLSKDGNKNEWAIAYHGIGIKMGSKFTLEKVTNCILKEGFKAGHGQAYAEDEDERHPGNKVGIGVYCSPDPLVMEDYAKDAETITSVNNRKFMMGFMIRVKPDKIRYSKDMREYWVLNGSTDEMRPYRILVKETDYIDLSKKSESINDKNILNSAYFNKKPQIIGKADWAQWVENRLINTQTVYHTYQNVLTEAAIIGLDGEIYARTGGLNITNVEFQQIKKLFSYDDYSYSYFILFLNLVGKKYRIIHYEKNFVVYLVRNECGVTIAKSNKTFIIGIYNNTQKYLYDGEQIKRQCIGMCNSVVEDLALHFKKIGF